MSAINNSRHQKLEQQVNKRINSLDFYSFVPFNRQMEVGTVMDKTLKAHHLFFFIHAELLDVAFGVTNSPRLKKHYNKNNNICRSVF